MSTSALTSGMQTALQQPGVLLFCAVEIVLPAATVRLVDGSGFASFGGNLFVGRDPTFGVLAGATAYTDGVDDTSPSFTLTLMSPSNTGVAELAAPAAQGSQVSIWQGAIDPVSGLVVPDPDLAFVGELDVPTIKVAQNTRSLEISVVSIFDRFLDPDEGMRLNNGFHQSVWPGELGLEFVTTVQQQLPWGSEAPRPTLVRDVPQSPAITLPNLANIRGFL